MVRLYTNKPSEASEFVQWQHHGQTAECTAHTALCVDLLSLWLTLILLIRSEQSRLGIMTSTMEVDLGRFVFGVISLSLLLWGLIMWYFTSL